MGNMAIDGIMYLHHNYPKLYRTKDAPEEQLKFKQTHIAEVWEVEDQTYKDIEAMELVEGYESMETKQSFGKKAKIFYMPWKNFDPTDKQIEQYCFEVLDKDTQEYIKKYVVTHKEN